MSLPHWVRQEKRLGCVRRVTYLIPSQHGPSFPYGLIFPTRSIRHGLSESGPCVKKEEGRKNESSKLGWWLVSFRQAVPRLHCAASLEIFFDIFLSFNGRRRGGSPGKKLPILKCGRPKSGRRVKRQTPQAPQDKIEKFV